MCLIVSPCCCHRSSSCFIVIDLSAVSAIVFSHVVNTVAASFEVPASGRVCIYLMSYVVCSVSFNYIIHFFLYFVYVSHACAYKSFVCELPSLHDRFILSSCFSFLSLVNMLCCAVVDLTVPSELSIKH